MSNNQDVLDMMKDNFNYLRNDLNRRFDKIDDKFESIEHKLSEVVTFEECKKKRKDCIENLKIKKSEISVKKITAIGGVIVGTVSASSLIIVSLIKFLLGD